MPPNRGRQMMLPWTNYIHDHEAKRIMEVMENGTLCSSICQHPSCWDTVRRRRHGLLPRATQYSSGVDSDDSSDELPTQKIVNLLENYGSDPVDVYSSSAVSVKARQSRSVHKSLRAMPSSYTMDSCPRLWAPHATPASLMQSSTGQVSSVVSGSEKQERQSKMGKVEVQEVFELTELHDKWNEICRPKQYYVWMPNTKRKATKPKSAIKRVHNFKDVTEEMMPREIEWEREATIVRHPTRNYTPYLYRWSTGSSLPYTPESQYINNMGIYELLDLPRDVLTQVLNYVSPRDMRDAHKVADAVAKAMSKVDKSTTLDLANSDVLHQRKMELLDVSQRSARGPHMDSFHSQMIWPHTTMTSPCLHPTKKRSAPVTPQNTTLMASHSNQDETRPSLAKHKPLPSIRGKYHAEGRRTRTQIPTISLGLPALSSDIKVARPFNYKLNTKVDLTLGHIPTPPTDRSYEHGMSPDWVSLTQRPTLPSRMSGQEDLRSPDFNGGDMEVDIEGRSPEVTASGTIMDTSQMVAVAPTRAPVNTPDSPYMRTLERQVSGLLGTIQEHDTSDVDWSRGGPITPPPTSRRSVRFTGEVPAAGAAGAAAGDESTAGGDHSTLRHGTPSVAELFTMDSDKVDAGPKLGERADSAACAASPDRWPVVDEDTYRHRPAPTPVHTPGTMSTGLGDNEATTSTAGNLDARSERSGLTSMLAKMSRENSLHSNKAKHIMKEPPSASPAPPPPSPEPKVAVATVPPSPEPTAAGSAEANTYTAIGFESDSEPGFDLTVMPPSNLDDESRINTPMFCLRTPSTGSRERSTDGQPTTAAGDAIALLEEFAASPEKEQEEHRAESAGFLGGGDAIGVDTRDASARVYGYHLTVESTCPKVTEPTAVATPTDGDEENDAEDASTCLTPQENKETNDPSLENESGFPNEDPPNKKEQAEDGASVHVAEAPAAGEAGQAGDVNILANDEPADVAVHADSHEREGCLTIETSAEQTAAIQPGYGAQADGVPCDGDGNYSQLEEFDASEANFEEELKQEYDKWSSP